MKRRALLRALAVAPWLARAPIPAWAKDGTDGIIAAAFGTIPPASAIRRVFAAGAPAGVLIYAIAPEKLLGWPLQLSAEARALLAPATRDLPFLGRLAGRGSTVSVETLLQLKPDLILDAGTADATYITAAQKVTQQTGLPCVLTHGRLAEHPAQLREVGRLLGVIERSERLAAYADATVALAARRRAATLPENRPRVYFGHGTGGLETGLEGSINMELIEFSGGRNVAAAAGKGGLTRVSPEQILAWNPEVILTQDRNFARRVLTDPLWRSLAAVRAGRVHCAPSLPFGWLDGPPGVNRLIGVRWLLATLYPGPAPALARDELRVETFDFYRLFYGVALTNGALDDLLEGAA